MRRFYFKYTGHSQLHVGHDGIQMHFVLIFLWNIVIRLMLSTAEIFNQDNTFGNTDLQKCDECHWAFACNLQGYLFFVIISAYCTNIKLVFMHMDHVLFLTKWHIVQFYNADRYIYVCLITLCILVFTHGLMYFVYKNIYNVINTIRWKRAYRHG